ncbi:MAG TPA: hypothetical protein VL854_10525 [Nitrososphaeraceae archaeon]|nr:hypothetical protein [Nitrososphaeraceae archaeon]
MSKVTQYIQTVNAQYSKKILVSIDVCRREPKTANFTVPVKHSMKQNGMQKCENITIDNNISCVWNAVENITKRYIQNVSLVGRWNVVNVVIE